MSKPDMSNLPVGPEYVQVPRAQPWPTEFKILRDRKDGQGTTVFEVEGEATAPGIDYGGDRLLPGALKEHLGDYQDNPLYTYCHNAMFPIGTTFDQELTSQGLVYKARIISNPVHQLAEMAQLLIREKACRRSSIGYAALNWKLETTPEGHKFRDLLEVRLHEISAAPLAMSAGTSVAPMQKMLGLAAWDVSDAEYAEWEEKGGGVVTADEAFDLTATDELKGAARFADLPLAPEGTRWQWNAKVGNAVLGGENWARYRKAHFWYDPENRESKAGYKLPFARMFDDELKAVWRACAAAMAALMGGRGGVRIKAADRRPVYNHIKRYYTKFEKPMPEFKGELVDGLMDPDVELPPFGEIDFKADEPEIFEQQDLQDNIDFIDGRTQSVANCLTHLLKPGDLSEEKVARALSGFDLQKWSEIKQRTDEIDELVSAVIKADTDKHGDGEETGARSHGAETPLSREDYLTCCRALRNPDPAAVTRELTAQLTSA